MDNLTGNAIKGYEIRELIGRGGFGVVYRAYQEAVKREVAIKIILPQYANQSYFIRNFQFEAQLIARLEHIHIVPLYDFWRDPQGAYIVMRWLRGGSLRQLIKSSGALDVSIAARILEQISSALETAHHNDVVHSDLKTANILLDEDMNAYLTDFGIAKDLAQRQDVEADDPNNVPRGSPEYMAPEQILNVSIDRRTDVYSLGIVLYEMLTGSVPFKSDDDQIVLQKQLYDKLPALGDARPDLPESFNTVIQRATDKHPKRRYQHPLELAVDFRQAVDAWLNPVIAPRASTEAEKEHLPVEIDVSSLAEPINPYKGLRAFQESDATDFYGRKELTDRLLGCLKDSGSEGRFLAVVGPSGIGKSSVVKAGVIPAIRNGMLPGSANWYISEFVPGSSPFEKLIAALNQVSTVADLPLAEMLQQDEEGLHKVLNQILPAGEQLLLLIDQFEELFTLTADVERRQFLSALMYAINEHYSRLRVIITLRADFYDRPLLYSDFGDLLRRRTEIVLPLTTEQLREAIVRPAENAGLHLEEGLTDAIIAEIVEQPGALPLLQYALRELFDNRSGRTLTLAAYSTSGGVSGAMTRRADDLYVQLGEAARLEVQQLFLRLVALGEGSEDTRRRVRRTELMSLGHEQVMADVIELYGRYRLLSFDHDPETRTPTIEIAHEALIRTWARLRNWLDDSRGALRTQRQLAISESEWRQSEFDKSYLAAGARLEQFVELKNSEVIALSKAELTYIDASEQLHQAMRRRQRVYIMVLTVVAIAATVASIIAVLSQQRVSEARDDLAVAQATTVAERDLSQSRALAVSASSVEEFDLALLLGVNAMSIADTFNTRDTLLRLLQRPNRIDTYLNGHENFVRALDLSPDGQTLVSGGQDGTVRLWSLEDALESAEAYRYGNWVNAVIFSPDGTRIASAGQDRVITIHDAQTLAPIGEAMPGHTDIVWSLAFNPDGQILASGGEDRLVRLWDMETQSALESTLAHEDIVYQMAFNSDGSLLATASGDGLVRIWDMDDTSEPLFTIRAHQGAVRVIAFNPVGNLLLSGGEDGVMRLWNVRTGEAFGDAFTGHTTGIRAASFIGDGRTLISAGFDGRVLVWDVNNPRQARGILVQQDAAILAMDMGASADVLVTAGHNHRIIVWDAGSPLRLGEVIAEQGVPVVDLNYSESGMLQFAVNDVNARSDQNALVTIDRSAGSEESVLMPEAVARTIRAITISPDGRWMAKAASDVTVWDAVTGEMIGESLVDLGDLAYSVKFSPDARVLAAGSDTGALMLWRLSDDDIWQPVGTVVNAHEDRIWALAFSGDSSQLVTGSWDTTVKRWQITADGPEQIGEVMQSHAESILSVAVNDDATVVVSGDESGVIIYHDLLTGREVPLSGHVNRVNDLVFAPDGKWLASASRDNSIILWDLDFEPGGIPRMIGSQLIGRQSSVNTLEFSEDSARLAAGYDDGAVMTWQVSPDTWVAEACAIVNRDLSDDERRLYLISVQAATEDICG